MKFPRFKGQIPFRMDLKYLLKLIFRYQTSESKKESAEACFRSYFQREATFMSSYRVGLYFSLNILKLEPGTEVLIGPLTIPDAIHSILFNKLKPVFVDLDPADHIVDLASLRQRRTVNTKVLIVTYLSGLAPSSEKMKSLVDFCLEYQIQLIEDVTQAYGATVGAKVGANINGHFFGQFGRFAIGSFSAGKLVTSTYGGVVASSAADKKLLKDLTAEFTSEQSRWILFYKHLYFCVLNLITQRAIFSFLTYPWLWLTWSSKVSDEKPRLLAFLEKFDPFNDEFLKVRRECFPRDFFFRLNDWKFELLIESLSRLPEVVKRRQEKARYFCSRLAPEVRQHLPPAVENFSGSNYYHFPIRSPIRNEGLREALFFGGIDLVGYGLNLCHRESIFSEYTQECPQADLIKQNVLFLPFHEDYSLVELDDIAEKVNQKIQPFLSSLEVELR